MDTNDDKRLRDSVLTLAGIVCLLAACQAASEIVVPFLLSLFLAIIAITPVKWLISRKVPASMAIGVVLLTAVALVVLTSVMIGASISQFNESLPEYQQRLSEIKDTVVNFLLSKGIDIGDAGVLKAIDPGVVFRYANNAFLQVADILGNSMLIMFTVMFILFDAVEIPKRLAALPNGANEKTVDLIVEIVRITNDYTVLKALVSLLTGVVVWVALELVGLDFALLWGVVAFALNFIPNIGSILAAVPAVLLGLIQFGPMKAAVIIAIYIGINTIVGNVIEPQVMGKKLGLTTLAVFLSLIFWGWLFGPVGMLLSVPLTMAVKFAAMSNSSTKWFAILLGSPSDQSSK